MKRNNLMKRMAVVALAATMSVGMAVPAMAQTSASASGATSASGKAVIENGPTVLVNNDTISVETWYQLNSFNDKADVTFFNEVITSGAVGTAAYAGPLAKNEHAKDFLIGEDDDSPLFVNQARNEKGHYSYIDVAPKAVTKFVTTNNGAYQFTTGDTTDNSDYVLWTVKAVNDNYFDATVNGRTVTFKANEFGTTIYKYEGQLYHDGKYIGSGSAGDVTGYIAVTMPLNRDTIAEVAKTGLTVTPTAAANSTKAAKAATDSIQKVLNDRKPKMLVADNELWFFNQTVSAFTPHVLVNAKANNDDHNLVVNADNVSDFHAATATSDGWFKAHVTVTDTTLTDEPVVDLGILTFAIKPDDTPVFDDVASTAYYYDAVVWGVKNGVVKGTSATTFSPYQTFTREQVALMLYREAGSPEVDYSTVETVKFHDIGSLSKESKKAIAWGVKEGIIKGTSDTTFGPKEGITRAQLVTLLYRASGDNAEYNEDGFTDVEHGKYYEDAVNWAVAKGVTTGTTKTTFSPYDVTTRAQGITFLYRYYNL